MSEEQLKAFIAIAKDDQSIQDKLKAAKSPEDVDAIAKDHVHDFGSEHISQLSEEELEGVAGGTGLPVPHHPTTIPFFCTPNLLNPPSWMTDSIYQIPCCRRGFLLLQQSD